MNKKQEYKDFIVELAKLFKPKVYVEIGAKAGYVINAVSEHAERAIAVDLKLSGIKDGIEQFQMSSEEFSFLWKDPIDLLFIDADHRAEAVLNDLDYLSKFVVPETGLILLHDTFPVNERLLQDDRCSDAWRVARMIHMTKFDYEIVTLPGPWAGLSIIRPVPFTHGWMHSLKDNKEGWK